MALGLCLLPHAVLPAQAHALTAEGTPPLLPLLQLYSRALADAPCEASRYGSSAVIYPFTETDDDVESMAAGVVQAKRDLPEATVLVTDAENSGLDVPIGHLSGASRLLSTLERINVRGVKRLPSQKRSTDTLNEAENVVRRRAPCTHCTLAPPARTRLHMHACYDRTLGRTLRPPATTALCTLCTLCTLCALCTLDVCVRSCLAANVSALLLVAPPVHLPRALLTTLSVLKRLRGAPSAPRLHVFSVAGGRSGGAWWGEAAAHSQGAVGRTRTELVSGELDRLVSYAAKGDLISPTEALQMLDERDREVSETVMAASVTVKTHNLHQQGCTIVYGCKEGICDD